MEIMNPIDDDRLKLDSVCQIKEVVRAFYLKKQIQCDALLESLDKMTSERPYSLSLKKDMLKLAIDHITKDEMDLIEK